MLCITAPAGAGWSRPSELPLVHGDWGREANLVVDGETIHIVWRAGSTLRHARSVDCGDTWSPGSVISRLTIGLVGKPGLAVAGDNVHVVWHGSGTGGHQVYFSRSEDLGQTWSSKRQLSEGEKQNLLPTILMMDDVIYVAWMQGNRSFDYPKKGRVVIASSYDQGANWSSKFASPLVEFPGNVFFAGQPKTGRQYLAFGGSFASALSNWKAFLQVRLEPEGIWTRPVVVRKGPFRINDILALGSSFHLLWREVTSQGGEPVSHQGNVPPALWEKRRRLSSKAARSRPGSGAVSAALAGAGRKLVAGWESWGSDREESDGIFVSRSPNLGRKWRRAKRVADTGQSPTLAMSAIDSGRCRRATHLVFRGRRSEETTRRPLLYSRRPAKLD